MSFPKRNISQGIDFRVLDKKKIEEIHEVSLEIMEELGVKIEGDDVVEILKEKGVVFSDNNIAKIPRGLVQKSLELAPKNITIYNRDGEVCIEMDEKRNIYFGSGADQFEFLQPETNEPRDFVREDIKTICTISDCLPNMDFILATGVFREGNSKIACQQCFCDVLKYYTKGIQVCTSDTDGLKDILEFAVEFAGGPEALREKPFFMYYAEPISPRSHPEESTLRIKLCAEHGIPFVYMPYSMMGATAPMSKAAIIVQNNVEVLTGLVISQAVREKSSFIYGAMNTIMDMKTNIGSYGCPEFYLCNAASSEMAEYYGLPFYGTGSVTDASTMDYQAVSEMQLGLMSSIMSKASFVHDVGEMGHSYGISPVNIVLANEIIEQVKHFVVGVEVNKEAIMYQTIKEVGPANHYLEEDTTLEQYRDVWYPELYSRNMVKDEKNYLHNKIIDKINDILITHKVPSLSQDKIDIIEKHEKIWQSRY